MHATHVKRIGRLDRSGGTDRVRALKRVWCLNRGELLNRAQRLNQMRRQIDEPIAFLRLPILASETVKSDPHENLRESVPAPFDSKHSVAVQCNLAVPQKYDNSRNLRQWRLIICNHTSSISLGKWPILLLDFAAQSAKLILN